MATTCSSSVAWAVRVKSTVLSWSATTVTGFDIGVYPIRAARTVWGPGGTFAMRYVPSSADPALNPAPSPRTVARAIPPLRPRAAPRPPTGPGRRRRPPPLPRGTAARRRRALPRGADPARPPRAASRLPPRRAPRRARWLRPSCRPPSVVGTSSCDPDGRDGHRPPAPLVSCPYCRRDHGEHFGNRLVRVGPRYGPARECGVEHQHVEVVPPTEPLRRLRERLTGEQQASAGPGELVD